VVSASLVASVGLSTGTVLGGNVVNGAVQLSGPAPREGAVVNLSASPGVVSFRNAAGAIVGSVVVPAGATNVAFGVATQVLGTGESQAVTIFALIPGSSLQSTTLTVRGPSKSLNKDNKDNRDSGGGGGKLTMAERQEPFKAPDLMPGGLEATAGLSGVDPMGSAFIVPEERPDVGAAALEQTPPAPPAEEKPKRARRRRKQPG
jgi:hypothetical protein